MWRSRLTVETMLKVREWERFKFFVDYEHRQVVLQQHRKSFSFNRNRACSEQQKDILQRPIPDLLKLAIAEKIEDNLFSKVAAISRSSSL